MGKKIIQKILSSFLVIFLLLFMVLIFGPSEIFFSNTAEFKFVYGDFIGQMAIKALLISAIGAIIIGILPDKVNTFVNSIIFAISVAGYIQVMFINEGLDLLGMNPEGYVPEKKSALINIIFWGICIVLFVIAGLFKDKIWKKILVYGSVFLILIQGVALVSLAISADKSAYEYVAEGEPFLSGKDQFTVSADKNVIVIILDYFSNQYVESALQEYPDLLDDLNDFTYYDNADCVYFGTYPSLAHMLSGHMVDTTVSINDWTKFIWQNDYTQYFYQSIRDKNFVTNIYTPDKNMLCGINSVDLLDGIASNITTDGQDLVVDHELLTKTMGKMSCYRFAPYSFKNKFYVQVDAYADVVQQRDNRIQHNNYDFYEELVENGLTVDNEKNYYIFQHLMGPHIYSTTADGHRADETSREETIKGCMVVVGEYINQLKKLGVYDNSTIIITADHGSPRESQVIFYMKEPNETHETMQVKHSPISHNEYMATIARAVGLDYSPYGKAVTDIPENEKRERTYWIRLFRDNLPYLQKYNGEGEGVSNAYCGFVYTGDAFDLMEKYDGEPDYILQEFDCFF